MRNAVVCLVATVGLLAPLADAGIIYVDDDAPPGGNGQSWTTAFAFLQDALAIAQAGDEIRVGGGVYYPDRDAAHPAGTGDRDVSFNLVSGVAIYGGYAGLTLPNDPDHRDLELYTTTLSGNIGSPTSPRDNSRHVVKAIGTAPSTLLDGLTISDGHGTHGYSSSLDENGLGIRALGCSLTVRECTIANNVGGVNYGTMGNASTFGGGIYSEQSELNLIGCTLTGNAAGTGGELFRDFGGVGGDGGAVYACNASVVRIVLGVLADNRGGDGGHGTHNQYGGAGGRGGAIFVGTASRVESINCRWCGNRAGNGGSASGPGGTGGDGGGFYVDASSYLQAVNCQISGNQAGSGANGGSEHPAFGGNGGNGGAICTSSADVRLINCTVAYNDSGLPGHGNGGDGQPGQGGALYADNVVPVVMNSILWLSSPEAVAGQADITYSDVQGGWPGTGNTPADPLFVNPNGPDNDPNTWADNDYRLSPGSPCIDAGSNLAMPRDVYDLDGDGCVTELLPVDLDGFVRYIDDPNTPDTGLGAAPLVDMGAFEFGATQPPVGGPCPGDLNCDGVIDFDDINPFVLALSDPAAYQLTFPNCFVSAADCNNDDLVNFDDINPFVVLLSGKGG